MSRYRVQAKKENLLGKLVAAYPGELCLILLSSYLFTEFLFGQYPSLYDSQEPNMFDYGKTFVVLIALGYLVFLIRRRLGGKR